MTKRNEAETDPLPEPRDTIDLLQTISRALKDHEESPVDRIDLHGQIEVWCMCQWSSSPTTPPGSPPTGWEQHADHVAQHVTNAVLATLQLTEEQRQQEDEDAPWHRYVTAWKPIDNDDHG